MFTEGPVGTGVCVANTTNYKEEIIPCFIKVNYRLFQKLPLCKVDSFFSQGIKNIDVL